MPANHNTAPELIDQADVQPGRLARRVAAGGLAALAMAGCSSPETSEPPPNPTTTTMESTPSSPTISEEISPSPTSKNEQQAWQQHDRRFARFPDWLQNFEQTSRAELQRDWNIFVGPAPANDEAQYYTDRTKNIRLTENGLVLRAHHEQYLGQDYTSARLDTLGKQSFKYGKLEITAKLPGGIGTWPAVWMLNTRNKYELPGQNSDVVYTNGEIDIVEAIGKEPHQMYQIAHRYDETNTPSYYGKTAVPTSDERFHTYGLEWTPQLLAFTIDGKTHFQYEKPAQATFKTWPYDQPYYLIVNLALGGVWAAADPADYPPAGIDNKALPAEMQIRSVRYYPYIGGKAK